MSLSLIVIIFVIAGVGVVVLPAMPASVVLGAILLIRSFSDVGASTGGSLVPSSAVSGALGVLAIAAVFMPSGPRPSTRATVVSCAGMFFVALWTLVGIARYQASAGMLAESLRLVSLIAVALLAARVAKVSGPRALRVLVIASSPSAVVLCLGYFARIPVTVSLSGRAVGTFSHANAAAAFLAALALLLLSLYLRDRRRGTLVLTALSIVALLLTESLGGIAAFAAGAAVLVILSTSMSTARKVLLTLMAVAAATVAFSVSGASQRVSEFQAFNAETAISTGVSDDSLGWRLINWSILLQRWAEHPLMGFGLGSTQTFVMPLGAPPHSAFVQVLVETGLVGAAIIGVSLIAYLRGVRASLARGSWNALTAIAFLAMLVVNGSESNLLGYTATMYLVVALLAILAVTDDPPGKTLATMRPEAASAVLPVRARTVVPGVR
ncbi:O-antigen ligase domain-containing protein [Clavibacter michiganensis]|nr:O-antigen ligase domain-containing protein [Clavibacter michiganensis]